MTAVPPRPAGFATGLAACVCGHPLVNHWQTGKRLCMACPDGGCPDFTPRPSAPMSDDGYLLLAIADDFLTEHAPDDGPVDVDDVYDWLVAQAHKVGGAA